MRRLHGFGFLSALFVRRRTKAVIDGDARAFIASVVLGRQNEAETERKKKKLTILRSDSGEGSATRITRICTNGILKQGGNRENGVNGRKMGGEKSGLQERTELWQKDEWQKNG